MLVGCFHGPIFKLTRLLSIYKYFLILFSSFKWNKLFRGFGSDADFAILFASWEVGRGHWIQCYFYEVFKQFNDYFSDFN